MPYRTIRTETRVGNGHRVTYKKEWVDLERRFTVDSMIGGDEISRQLAKTPIQYEYEGKLYEDIPERLINSIDDEYYNHGMSGAALESRARAIIKVVKEKASQIKREKAEKEAQELFMRGEFKAMRHNNFSEYIDDMKDIYKVAAQTRTEAKAKAEKAKAAYDAARKDPKISEYGLMSAKMKYLEAQGDYEKAIEDMRTVATKSISDIRSEFNEHIADFYSAKGSQIDADAAALLKSGIKLKSAEIEKMIQKYNNNPTMIRLLSDYCIDNGIENKTVRAYALAVERGGKFENQILDNVELMIGRVLGRDETLAQAWSRDIGAFERLANDAKAGLSTMTIRPYVEDSAIPAGSDETTGADNAAESGSTPNDPE